MPPRQRLHMSTCSHKWCLFFASEAKHLLNATARPGVPIGNPIRLATSRRKIDGFSGYVLYLRAAATDRRRQMFVKGLFQETTAIRNRLVVNVDCDLYSAACSFSARSTNIFARHYRHLRRFLLNGRRVQGFCRLQQVVRSQLKCYRPASTLHQSSDRDQVLVSVLITQSCNCKCDTCYASAQLCGRTSATRLTGPPGSLRSHFSFA
jgi:hypothetical protein